MKINDQFNFDANASPNKTPARNTLSSHCVNTYTVLCILRKMKNQMGLEVMLEYLEKYLEVIENYNPRLKMAVIEALSRLNVEKIYQEACLCQEKREET